MRCPCSDFCASIDGCSGRLVQATCRGHLPSASTTRLANFADEQKSIHDAKSRLAEDCGEAVEA